MINNKLILGIAIISIIYTGCDEKETTPVVEKQAEIKVKELVPKVVTEVKLIEKKEVVIAPIIKQVKAIATEPNGQILYKKCASCHGQNAEKKALNKSAIIQDWDASKIANALKGYKNGTYGGAMKGIMKGQVVSMSEKEIDLVSEHIASFK